MAANPYQTPASDPVAGNSPKTRPLLGVVAGFVVDVGGTLAIGLVVGIVMTVVLMQGGGLDNTETFFYDPNPLTPMNLALASIGLLMSLLGGMVCSRVARARNLLPGLALAVTIVLFEVFTTDESELMTVFVLLLVARFAATMFGAWTALPKSSDGA